VPLGEGDACLVGPDGGKDLQETVNAVGWQFDGLTDRVNEPPKHHLAGGPTPVAFQKLLNGDGLLTVGAVGGVKGAEHRVDGSEEDAAEALAPDGVALRQADGVIHEDVKGAQRFGVGGPATLAGMGRLWDWDPVVAGGVHGGVLRRRQGISEGIEAVGSRPGRLRLTVSQVHSSLGGSTEVGGDSVQPMGSTRGKATRGSVSGRVGNTTPSLGMSPVLTHTR
jgi:hypothetical protein